MVRLLGKRKQRLIITVVLVVVVFGVALTWRQESLAAHKYPRQAVYEDSNLLVRGVVLSIEKNYVCYGLGFQGWFGYSSYHSFRYYILLNITEVVWSSADLSEISGSLWSNTFREGGIIGIGYDSEYDLLEVDVGQTVECKDYYFPITDTPCSHIITVMPTVTDSFLKPRTN